MAQRPMVRPDSAETRSKHQSPLTRETTHPQRDNPSGEYLYRNESPSRETLDEVLKLVAEQACLATSASASAIALAEDGAMVCRATAGAHAPELGQHLNIDTGLTGACARTGQVQYCEDTENDARVNAEACRRLQVRSVLVVPVHQGGVLLGIVEIFSPFPQAFAPHDLDNLEALSRVVLENIRPPVEPAPAFHENYEPSVEISEPWEEISASLPEPSPPPLELSAIRWEPPEAESALLLPAEQQTIEEPAPKSFSSESEKFPRLQFEPVRDDSDNFSDPYQPAVEAAPKPAFSSAISSPPIRPENSARRATTAAAAARARISRTDPLPREAARLPVASQTVPEAGPQHRDWTTGLLTVTVVAVALLLGWMLGRAGWQHVIGSDRGSSEIVSSVAEAATHNPAASDRSSSGSDPTAMLPAPPVKDTAASHSSRTPFQPQPAQRQTEANGGLVVTQGGKVIFQQRARQPNSDSSDSDESSSGPASDPVSLSPEAASAYLVHRVEPIYPEEARLSNVSGDVHLEAVIGKDGTVQVLRLMNGNSQLAQAAAEAVRQWRFRPYKSAGKLQEFSTRLTVSFRLH
jgi:TonB family protein